MRVVFALVLLAAVNATAATNPPARWTTNWVEASEDFRIVQGKLYNQKLSQAFYGYSIEVAEVTTNIVIGRRYHDREIWHVDPAAGDLSGIGGLTGFGGGPIRTLVGTKREYQGWITVTNALKAKRGETVIVRAMPVGTRRLENGTVAEVVDCGTRRPGVWMAYSNGVARFAVTNAGRLP